jgi:hypothetical protein
MYNTIKGEGSGYIAITQRVGFSTIFTCLWVISSISHIHTHTHTHTHNSFMGMQIFKARMELLLSNPFPLCLIKKKVYARFIGPWSKYYGLWSNTMDHGLIPWGLIEKWMKSFIYKHVSSIICSWVTRVYRLVIRRWLLGFII